MELSSKEFSSNREGTGTREWSESSYNIGTGCSHGCIYCYARSNAYDRGIIKDKSEWITEKVNQEALDKQFGKRKGVIMYPTTHDITETYLEPSIVILKKMLEAGNQVLIVSKPHLECIKRICTELADFKTNILFRFTIGSLDKNICHFWEPNAPTPQERVYALKYAFEHGFNTSVSMEPMLSDYMDAIYTFDAIYGLVTDKIWIGKMNKIDSRVLEKDNDEIAKAIEKLHELQNDEHIKELYNCLKNRPKVCWKDSIKQVLGI